MAASILIADDDAVARRLVENMLQKCGYETVVVDSGDAAIALLTAPDAPVVDAVVLDLVMPGFYVFFFKDTATTEIYTLSLHDALPIYWKRWAAKTRCATGWLRYRRLRTWVVRDRKSTRLNSSHVSISYAVFCLKK